MRGFIAWRSAFARFFRMDKSPFMLFLSTWGRSFEPNNSVVLVFFGGKTCMTARTVIRTYLCNRALVHRKIKPLISSMSLLKTGDINGTFLNICLPLLGKSQKATTLSSSIRYSLHLPDCNLSLILCSADTVTVFIVGSGSSLLQIQCFACRNGFPHF